MKKATFLEQFRKYFIFSSREWIVKMYMRADPYLNRGSIIDIETTGLNPEPGDYYNPQSHTISLGIYSGHLIRIYQLAKPDYERFRILARRIARKTPQPRYAYAAHFEQSFLGIPEGWHDLTRYREPYYNDWENWHNYRYRLADVTQGPYEKPEDLDIDSSDVPQTWENWLRTKDWRQLAEISWHNYCDLLRERQLVN